MCQSVNLLASLQLAVLEPLFASICDFLVGSVLDLDEGVAMEACEFWSILSENADAHAAVRSHLPTLVPHLISRLVLTQEQVRPAGTGTGTERGAGDGFVHSEILCTRHVPCLFFAHPPLPAPPL